MATTKLSLATLNNRLNSLEERVSVLESSVSTKQNSKKSVKTSSTKKSVKSKSKSSKNDFDYDWYLAVASAMADEGLIELRSNGAPMKKYRKDVYKAMNDGSYVRA